jgi:hypothetical protein
MAEATDRRETPMIQAIAWAVVMVVGWVAFAWVATAVPGGLDAVWGWVRALPLLAQVVLWLLLLPWMAALWLSQMAWAPWFRWLLIVSLALATLWTALPPAFGLFGRGRQ